MVKILDFIQYIIINFYCLFNSYDLKYIWIIITLICLVWLWIWIFNQVFSNITLKVKYKSLLWWSVLVSFLALFDYAFDFFWIDKQLFYIRDVSNISSISIFLMYCLFVLLFISLLFRNLNNNKIILEISVAILSAVIIAFLWLWTWITVLIFYYILAAFSEEIFKFTVSNNQMVKYKDNKISIILLLSVLIWLSFSISENLYSFLVQIFNENLSIWFILGRGLIASLIHCVSTWAIALLLMKIKKWWLLFRYFVALLFGSLIHIIYNLSVVNNYTWVILILVLFALIFLSYLFFNIDEIYS
jgi:hypothetical protein